jgi:hypothetical protein
MTPVGNQQFQRALNTAHVMRLIRFQAPISRAEIADRLGLTRSTVSTIVTRLLDSGFLVHAGTNQPSGSPRGGRPALPLDFSPTLPPVIGVELRPDSLSAVSIDFHGKPLGEFAGPVAPQTRLDAAWVAEAVASALSELAPRGVFGVGLGMSASIDPVRGVVIQSTLFDSTDLPITDDLSRLLGAPVLADNDANCVAWGERQNGTGEDGRPTETIACVHLTKDWTHPSSASSVAGFGLGMGVVVDGSVHYGSEFSAGEMRSSKWKSHAPLQVSLDPRAFSSQDEFDRQAVTEILTDLGVISSVLRPDRILYSGDLLDLRSQIDSLLSGELAGSFIAPEVSGIDVMPASGGERAVAVGAAQMFLQQLFAVPGVGPSRPTTLPTWDALCRATAEDRS